MFIANHFSRSGVNVRAHQLRKNYSRNFSSNRSAPIWLSELMYNSCPKDGQNCKSASGLQSPFAGVPMMAFRWRGNDGPTLNAGLYLVVLLLFRESEPVLLRNPIFV